MTSFARTRILTLLVASSVALGGCATAEEPEAVAEDTAVIEESAEDIAVVAGEDDYVILYSGRGRKSYSAPDRRLYGRERCSSRHSLRRNV